MKTLPFPASLQTLTPIEGHALARQLASRALEERATSTGDMAAHLANLVTPSIEALTAAYFQAVSEANHGWPVR